MTKFLMTITAILFCSCIQRTESLAQKNSAPGDNFPDTNVALTFINEYVAFCTPKSLPGNARSWIRNSRLVTDHFIQSYDSLLDSALKTDPELGLDFDPIFDAQDFPDKGFVVDSLDKQNGIVTVKGKDWPEFILVIKLFNSDGRTLVEGCGVINIPPEKRAKR